MWRNDSLILEITGTEDKIDGLVEVLRPFGILEMVRTGRVAMGRGRRPTADPPRTAAQVSGEPSTAARLSIDGPQATIRTWPTRTDS